MFPFFFFLLCNQLPQNVMVIREQFSMFTVLMDQELQQGPKGMDCVSTLPSVTSNGSWIVGDDEQVRFEDQSTYM